MKQKKKSSTGSLIHLGHPCGCCWLEITKKNIHGNGYCISCMAHMKRNEDLPCKNWTKDMVAFWNRNGYLERKEFNMETRMFQKGRINPLGRKTKAEVCKATKPHKKKKSASYNASYA